MIQKEQIAQIVTHFLESSETFLVSVKVGPSNEIGVTVDSAKGVSLDQCVEISRAIEAALNREEEDFELTVSSAGLDQALQIFPQYLKYIGKKVEVLLCSGKKIVAELLAATPTKITLQYEEMQEVEGKKRKQKIMVTNIFDMTELRSTKPYIDFR